MSTLAEKLATNADLIERSLDALLVPGLLGDAAEPVPENLLDAMRHGTLGGGKRLRPFLVIETAALFGVSREEAIPPALAIELVHCYSLIHDDLPAMDDDDLRRGRPTVHRAFDEATAILAGDALLTLAFEVLAQGSATNATPLVLELARGAGARGMVGGQVLDIEGENGALPDARIASMQSMKTGALIRAAVRIGARVGGAAPTDLDALTLYAEAAGRAFQLADDILDVTATTESLGKAAGKDGDRNKATRVSRIGLDAARFELATTIDTAIAALATFGPRADTLRDLARYFGARSS